MLRIPAPAASLNVPCAQRIGTAAPGTLQHVADAALHGRDRRSTWRPRSAFVEREIAAGTSPRVASQCADAVIDLAQWLRGQG